MSSFEIRINGEPFSLWKSATVQRSIDNNCGAFRFSNSTSSPVADYPVKAGDFVEIIVAGSRMIAGFVDEITGSQDESSHTIEVSGRDNTADLIDSSVPDSAKVTEGPVTLKKLIENVIAALGCNIAVTNNVGNIAQFTSDDLQAAASGESCMDYLVNFARKRQVYLVTDGAGGLIIYRPDKQVESKTPLIHKRNTQDNNVASYSFRQSLQGRFWYYRCKSQDNVGFSAIAEYFGEGASRSGIATDNQIRKTRFLEFQAEQTMVDKDCFERAKEESNIRRALGTEYTASVPGVTQSDGTVWDFGQFCFIDDEYAGVKGTWLIKSVELAIDINAGTRSQIMLVPPDAYQVTAEPTKEDARTAKTGTAYRDTTGQAQGATR